MGAAVRKRKLSSWRSVQGVAATARDSFERARKPSGDYVNPWSFDNWSFDPAQISVYQSGSQKRGQKPGDAFSGRDESLDRPLGLRFRPTLMQIATSLLLLLSVGLVLFLFTQIL